MAFQKKCLMHRSSFSRENFPTWVQEMRAALLEVLSQLRRTDPRLLLRRAIRPRAVTVLLHVCLLYHDMITKTRRTETVEFVGGREPALATCR